MTVRKSSAEPREVQRGWGTKRGVGSKYQEECVGSGRSRGRQEDGMATEWGWEKLGEGKVSCRS